MRASAILILLVKCLCPSLSQWQLFRGVVLLAGEASLYIGTMRVTSSEVHLPQEDHPQLTVVITVQCCGGQHYINLLSVIGSACMKKRTALYKLMGADTYEDSGKSIQCLEYLPEPDSDSNCFLFRHCADS